MVGSRIRPGLRVGASRLLDGGGGTLRLIPPVQGPADPPKDATLQEAAKQTIGYGFASNQKAKHREHG